MEDFKINYELSLREANVLKKILQKNTPDTDDEMIVLMLFSRLTKLLEKHE